MSDHTFDTQSIVTGRSDGDRTQPKMTERVFLARTMVIENALYNQKMVTVSVSKDG